ncbi:MAG: hypothetical protein GY729_08480, partial [Desulfobacteraceae bacterium]|nr:hypothetical protein [Desulfobacteraceae bacterium]
MSLFQKLLHDFEKWMIPSNQARKDEWQLWREKIILYSLLAAMVLILGAFIPSFILLAYEHTYTLLGFATFLLIPFMGLVFIKNIPYAVRAWGVCTLLVLMGSSIMYIRGPFTSGLLWFYLSMVAGAVLLNLRAAILIGICNGMVIISIAVLLVRAPPDKWNLLIHDPLINWGITGVLFMVLSYITVYMLDYLLQAIQ